MRPFDTVAEALRWAWRDGADLSSGGYSMRYVGSDTTARPCEPSDVVIVANRVIARRRDPNEARKVIVAIALDIDRAAEHPLWPSLEATLDFALREKGIVSGDGEARVSRAEFAATSAHRRRLPHPTGWGRRRYGPKPQDLKLLWALMRARGRIVTYAALIDELYADRIDGGPDGAQDSVKECIAALNFFLAQHNDGVRMIENLRQIGYRLPATVRVPPEWQPPIEARNRP